MFRFNRRMHYTAILGFHRPFIELPKLSGLPNKVISSAFDAGVVMIAKYLELASKKDEFTDIVLVPMSLIIEMLLHERNNMFLIDTVNKAGRWNIDVFGLEPFKEWSDEMMYNACENIIAWKVDEYNACEYASTLDKDAIQKKKNEKGDGYWYYVISCRNGYSKVDCDFSSVNDGSKKVHINATNEAVNGNYQQWLSNFKFFYGEKKLIELGIHNGNIKTNMNNAHETQKFVRFYDVFGQDLDIKTDYTLTECLSICLRDEKCEGLTYDAWNHVCIEKGLMTELRGNPRAISWFKGDFSVPYSQGDWRI